MKRFLTTVLKTVVPLGLGIYLFWVFFANMSQTAKTIFFKALQEANYGVIILSLLGGFIAYLSRAYRWKYVLEPLGYQTKFWNRYHAIMIGYVVNLTIPRAGEASRSAILQRSDNVPFSVSFGTIIAERAVDLVILGSIALLTAFTCASDFEAIRDLIQQRFGMSSGQSSGYGKIVWILLISFLCLASFLLYRYPKIRKKVFDFIQSILSGVLSIFKSKNPSGYIFHSFLIWGLYVGMFWVTFFALEQTSSLPISAVLLGFLAGSVGVMFTNGGMGLYPLLIGLVISYYLGQTEESLALGNALGMLIWCTQTFLMIILGLISLALLPKKHGHGQASELSNQ
jgi:uncharacterized protein (TIRG00374 family)